MSQLGKIIEVGLKTMKPVLSPETIWADGRRNLNLSNDISAIRQRKSYKRVKRAKYLSI